MVQTVPNAPPAGDSALVAVGRPPAGDPALVDDVTTAIAIPLGATASIPVEAPPVRQPAPDATRTDRAPAAAWLGRATVVAALVLVIVVALVGLINSAVLSGPRGPAGTGSGVAPSSSAPPSPSIAASPSAVTPSPSLDPALASLNAMDAAISAARGGPDGLKGKDANDLEARAAEVRRALDAGDRKAALDAARKLDRRVVDVTKNLDTDQATRLRAASQDLVRALGG
jgi:hypothetical protein